MNGRATFDALSPADRAQLAVAFDRAFGYPSIDAGFRFLETEGIALYKLRLARGDDTQWDVWIDVGMDNGAVFHPGTLEPNIGVSQERVHAMTGSHGDLVPQIQSALDAFRKSPDKNFDEMDWVY